MKDYLDTGGLHDLVKGIGLGYVARHDNFKLVLVLVWVGFPNLLRLLLGANGGHNIVSFLEELLKDVSSNEAGSAYVCACKSPFVVMADFQWSYP